MENSIIKTMIRNLFCGTLVTITLLAVTAGCSRKTETGTISGKVIFRGTPIDRGTIIFIDQNRKVVSGMIRQGDYTAVGVAVGPDATVVVISQPVSPMMRPPGYEPEVKQPAYKPGQYVPIPPRFSDSKLSDLTYDVVAGTQTKVFDLQP